ncbi:hypothetical protein Bca4012_025976 [Brassica carinata]
MCYTYLLPAPWGVEQQRIDTLEGIKKEFVSIGYFHTFISNSTEQTHESEFLFKAQIVGVLQQNCWSFVSCTSCSRKLTKSDSFLMCFFQRDRSYQIQVRVELAVDDRKDSATFVVFNKLRDDKTHQERGSKSGF